MFLVSIKQIEFITKILWLNALPWRCNDGVCIFFMLQSSWNKLIEFPCETTIFYQAINYGVLHMMCHLIMENLNRFFILVRVEWHLHIKPLNNSFSQRSSEKTTRKWFRPSLFCYDRYTFFFSISSSRDFIIDFEIV